jgi:hypothetical protein
LLRLPLAELRLCRCLPRTLRVACRAQAPVVELGKELTFFNAVADPDVDTYNPAVSFRGDVCLLFCD